MQEAKVYARKGDSDDMTENKMDTVTGLMKHLILTVCIRIFCAAF